MPTEPSQENRKLAEEINPKLQAAGKVAKYAEQANRPKTKEAQKADEIVSEIDQGPRVINTNQFRK